MTGKAAVLQAPGKFCIEERQIDIHTDEVLVQVACCGLCNWEKGFYTGVLSGAPCTLGHEWSGVVREVGSDVSTLKAGDRVTVFPDKLQGFAEYAAIKASYCFKISDDVDLYEAFAEPLKCIITVLRSAAPEVGDYGVVVGCGPMGLWCVQALAGHMLAGLIAIDVDDAKLEVAKSYGAAYVINSKKEDAKKRIAEITGGHMADFVIEGTGLPQLVASSTGLLRVRRGRLVLMSYYEETVDSFDFRTMADLGAIITNPQPAYSEDGLEDTRRAVELINNKTFCQKDIITHRFSLDDIQEAFEALVNKPKGYIKGIVVCNENL